MEMKTFKTYQEYRKYSAERKAKIVQDYISGELSARDIAKKYGLSFGRVQQILWEFKAKSPLKPGTKKWETWYQRCQAWRKQRSQQKNENN